MEHKNCLELSNQVGWISFIHSHNTGFWCYFNTYEAKLGSGKSFLRHKYGIPLL